MRNDAKLLRRWVPLFTLGILELLALRVLVAHFAPGSLGFSFGTEWDYFLPGPVAIGLWIYLLHHRMPLEGVVSRLWLGLNLLSFLSLVLWTLSAELLPTSFRASWSTIWWSGLFFLVACGILAIVPPRYLRTHRDSWTVIPAILVFHSIPIFMNGFSWLWKVMLEPTTLVVRFLVETLASGSIRVVTLFEKDTYLQLIHPILNVKIGVGCSGGDGLVLYLILWGMFSILCRDKIAPRYFLLWGLSGIPFLFFVNVFRILFLFSSGILVRKCWGFEAGTWWVKNFAHAHGGWLLHFMATLSYFSLFLLAPAPMLSRRRKANTSSEPLPA